MPLIHPCIICFSSEHRALDCLRREEVQNMFQTKPTTTATVITKNLKLDHVPVNIVIVVMTRSQVLEEWVFKKHETMKGKTTTN
jgi:hypothetical protein